MVAYFKVQNNLFMAAGAGIGLLAAVACYGRGIKPLAGYTSLFVAALMVFAGVVAGRILSVRQAGKRLGGYLKILYREEDPERFLREFAPVVKRTPPHTAEYADGVHHLAYAWEAMGDYDRGLKLLEELEPENLKLHRLVTCAVVENQKLRLYLLKGDAGAAWERLEGLRKLQEAAAVRAPGVGNNLKSCIRLAEIWLRTVRGEGSFSEEDRNYIREEIALAANPIHRREMEGLLRRMGEIHVTEPAAVSP